MSGHAQSPARRYLEAGGDEEYAIATVTALKFLEGYKQARNGERFLDPFPQLETDSGVARIGSRIRRKLRESGLLIGDFDLLIAATALAAGLPLAKTTSATSKASRVLSSIAISETAERAPRQQGAGSVAKSLPPVPPRHVVAVGHALEHGAPGLIAVCLHRLDECSIRITQ